MRLAGWGLGLTAVTAGITWLVWGAGTVMASLVFGLLATGIQLAAVRLLRPAVHAPFAVLVKRWAMGIGLRLAGVVLFAVAVVWNREAFPPLPTALGYVGVVVPLLFMEARFLR